MIRALYKNKKYYLYAGSIIIARGLEYVVLLFSAYYLSKDVYGQLEFYKKIIEILAVGAAFGFPSLLLTYTKSNDSKVYFSTLSIGFILFLGLISAPILWLVDYQFLFIPLIFHSIFFNNGVLPVFCLTFYGSKMASYYKAIISIFFYLGVFLLVIFSSSPEKAFITVNYYLLAVGVIFLSILNKRINYEFNVLRRYYKLFIRLLTSSLSLVLSNFVNIMFLYTDILILKLISNSANSDIANYSFALNIANMLILIPFTFVQVDIESIKRYKGLKLKVKRIFKLVLLLASFLVIIYYGLISVFFQDFSETMLLFIVILSSKIIQANTVFYGTLVLIEKMFKMNLVINISILLLNIFLSYYLFQNYGLNGVAIASLISLATRFVLLSRLTKRSNYESK
jgi:O-antigen/teichoic acid export membrane protein